jgi:hypothetical protein
MVAAHGSNTIGAYEAKTHLSELLERVETRQEITTPNMAHRWLSSCL